MNGDIKKEFNEQKRRIIEDLIILSNKIPLGELSKFIAKITIEINRLEEKLKTLSIDQLKTIAENAGIKFFTENVSEEDLINIIMSDAKKEDLEKNLFD